MCGIGLCFIYPLVLPVTTAKGTIGRGAQPIAAPLCRFITINRILSEEYAAQIRRR